MDKLRAIRIFHAVEQEGSMTAAAARLGTSPPTVVRTIRQLEDALRVRLLNRNTRRMELTDEGRLYLEETRVLLHDLDALEGRIAGGSDLAGPVRLAAPVFFGERLIAPLIPDFVAAHPGLAIRLRLADRVEDLIDHRIDLALRIGHLPPSELRRTRVGEVRQVLCASPDLLAREEAPDTPEALAGRPCILIDGNDRGRDWPFADGAGNRRRVRVDGAITANTMRAARAACLAGGGFALLLSYQVADDIRQGRLLRLLPEAEPPPLPVQIVHAAGSLPPRRLTHVRDRLAERLGAALTALALPPP